MLESQRAIQLIQLELHQPLTKVSTFQKSCKQQTGRLIQCLRSSTINPYPNLLTILQEQFSQTDSYDGYDNTM